MEKSVYIYQIDSCINNLKSIFFLIYNFTFTYTFIGQVLSTTDDKLNQSVKVILKISEIFLATEYIEIKMRQNACYHLIAKNELL